MAWEPRAEFATQEQVRQALRIVRHDGSSYPARPSAPAGCVRYIGPTQPTDWQQDDEWINNGA